MPFMLALALGLGIAGWAPRPAPGSPAAVTPAPGVKPWEADPKGHMVGGGGLQQSLLHRPGGGNPPRRRLRPVAGVERTEGCRTRTVPQDTPQDTARAYLEDTFAALRDKGHIQDCRVDSLEFIPPEWDGESVGTNYMTYDDSAAVWFRAGFSLGPPARS